MLHVRSALALTATLACAPAREPPAAPPVAPAAAHAGVDHVTATRLPVRVADPNELARVLRDLFDVRPDRGDVRVILVDRDNSDLIVFATPEGLESLRRVLGPNLTPTVASM